MVGVVGSSPIAPTKYMTVRLLIWLFVAALSTGALAQQYPSRAIHLISPFPPGGSVDVVGRLVAARLSESLGQQMIVDNRSGASGVIGTEVVLNSPPDGYTLLVNTIPFVTNQLLLPRAPYDPLRDFVSISVVASAPSFVTVHPSVQARSVQELIALAKAQPGRLHYSTAGVGTNPHIAGELFNLLANVDIVAVHFKGGGPADTAVIAGEVAATFGNVSQQIGHVKSGRLRALAVTSTKRNPAMPELPTVAESGLKGYESSQWYGIWAPAGTPADILGLLNSQVAKIMQATDMKQRLSSEGLVAVGSSREQFAAHIRTETAKWANVIKRSGAKVD